LEFVIWGFEFFWDLGIWDLPPAHVQNDSEKFFAARASVLAARLHALFNTSP